MPNIVNKLIKDKSMFPSNFSFPARYGLTLLVLLVGGGLFSSFNISYSVIANKKHSVDQPRIVNIINFIRLLEPRDPAITEEVLFKTVVSQVELMKKHQLTGTFLLQYDALMDKRYQDLLRSLPRDSFEIGAWWEIPQPLVEKAGLKWRGQYPWDWRANIGFATGYTPVEREKLADVYMEDFKKIFGYYPRSVGSWFIDAHTLNYLYTKYGIVASCNCKDQYGTDGYTLWGGYWNQAYYPSKRNAYMPAQHAEAQIPVPIFRMLGSDPIRQYDDGAGRQRQGVVTLEPVYPHAGGDSIWVNWFFKQFVQGASMAFAYTQAGQENSFTWLAMEKGLNLQFTLIEKLRDEKKIKLETLAQSGEWFKNKFPVTPSTSVTITEDMPGGDQKTVWFNSRYYRANLLWDKGTLRFRDIHIFDENLSSVYEDHPATSNECSFFTLPVVEGFLWGAPGKSSGLVFKEVENGDTVLIKGGDPVVDDATPGELHITWPLQNYKGKLEVIFTEQQVSVSLNAEKKINWFLDLDVAGKVRLPFEQISATHVDARFEGLPYTILAEKGSFSATTHSALRITPEKNMLRIKL